MRELFRVYNKGGSSSDDPCLKRDTYLDNKVNLRYSDYRTDKAYLCSGIKDQNGNLIYEGDVLKDGRGGLHEVIFRDSCFFLKFRHNNNTLTDRIELSDWNEHLEIIGNIVENPEISPFYKNNRVINE